MLQLRLISARQLVRWLPVLVIGLAAGWRLHELPRQSFWHDEGNTLRLVQRDVPDLLAAVRPDIHPPGYYLLLKGWTGLAGEHEFGLRTYSAFWGVLAVALTYALGARLYARAAGILAALLVAVNPLAVYYSQEARMYAQLAGLAVLGMWLLARFVSAHPARRPAWGLALALCNALGLYTHYSYPLTLLVQGLFFGGWWLAQQRPTRPMFLYAALNLLSLALFAPWLPTALDQTSGWAVQADPTPFAERLQTVLTHITYGNTAQNLGPVEVLAPLALVAVLLLPDWYPQPPGNRWRAALPLAWALAVAGGLLFSGAYREANLKFLLPGQIALALVIGRGAYLLWDVGSGSAAVPLEMLPRLISGGAFFLTLGTAYGWLDDLYSDPDFQRDDYRAIAAIIQQQAGPDDAVILNAGNQIEVFSYYYGGQAALHPLPRGLGGDDAATLAATEALLARHPRIFMIYWASEERDPNQIIKNTLDERAYSVGAAWYGNVRLLRYAVLAPPPPAPTTLSGAQFGEHITLTGYAINGTAQPGGVLGVTLFWTTAAPLDVRYKVSVQLLDSAGRLVSQHDSEPANNRALTTLWQPGEGVADNHGLPIPSNTPPGDYTLSASLYTLEPPFARLPVEGGDSLTLERISLP
ncbi:MAG: phospholipid carrier-dependent glycosyltransferase [Anaerolineae bacterium]|nr:phospholipid carrier-dependent glycosyltransferase [Anaerolineae bacterium]